MRFIDSNHIFVDVDTQRDFMNKEGALYVPGAEEIKPNLLKLTEFAIGEGIPILKTFDWHNSNSPELEKNGGAFPKHCMQGTPGACSIEETNSEEAIIYLKDCYNIFDPEYGDHAFWADIRFEEVETAVVYGVATDYCVKETAIGLLDRGVKVTVVTDAISGVDIREGDSERALEAMIRAGAVTRTVSEL